MSKKRETYFKWLCSLVMNTDRKYDNLLLALHNKPFKYFVPNDDNRAFEGLNLREHYCEVYDINFEASNDILYKECTMLELIISLSKRCESLVGDICLADWFWILLRNVGLSDCTDDYYYNMGVVDYIDGVLEKIINRRYTRNGQGGLFPLKKSRKDQRKVELWYQMSEYLVENYFTDSVVV